MELIVEMRKNKLSGLFGEMTWNQKVVKVAIEINLEGKNGEKD